MLICVKVNRKYKYVNEKIINFAPKHKKIM